ncbi:MAG: hypothetical protein COA79_00025 [Planctomycetota bacterium]|nr:MAG: hypothetical protein COA79_00025 [Planctomycetota bacterium]
MASPIRSTGLASGLPVNDIIEQMMELSRAPIRRIEAKKATNEAKRTALQFVSAQTLNLSLISFDLSKVSTFHSKSSTSSNENILVASASSKAASGSYTFKVGQIAQAAQVISKGIQDQDSTAVGSGTITLNKGRNTLNQSTDLSYLNGGDGIENDSIKITDDKGNVTKVDLSTSLTINDIIEKINNESNNITASISSDGSSLQLKSKDGSDFSIEEISNGSVAEDLGILSESINGQIAGSTIHYVNEDSLLSIINDGLGIDITTSGINDLTINRLEGNKTVETINLDLSGAETVGDILNKINEATGVENLVTINESRDGISINNDNFKFLNFSDSDTATQLGITGTDTEDGKLISGLNDTLLRNLNGSQGIEDGEFFIDVEDHGTSDTKSTKIRVNQTSSLNDLINQINDSNSNVTASINQSGNGIQITSNESDATITIRNGDGFNTATELGLETDGTIDSIIGSNLHKRTISNNTTLASLNDGDGIGKGTFEIQLSSGVSKEINFKNDNLRTIKDAIIQIQGQFLSEELKVRINDNGDGLVIEDLTDGTGIFRITDSDDQSVATSFNIAKTADKTSNIIDGTSEVIIEVNENDTLDDLASKINKLDGIGVKASIINDGRTRNAYRLSIVADKTGASSNILINSTISSFDFKTSAEGLDSIVSYGSSQGLGNPITLTSSDLSITGGVSGLDLELKGISENNITITVNRESESIKEKITEFTDKFNEIIKNIKNLTRFVPSEELQDIINTGAEEGEDPLKDVDAASGLLLGNSTLRRVQTDLFNLVSSNVEGISSSIRSFSQVGIVLGSDGVLNFDEDKFEKVYQSNTDEVVDIFTLSKDILNKNTNRTSATIGGGLTVVDGFDINSLLAGITSSSNYQADGSGDGVKFKGTGYIDFNLGETQNIKRILFNQINNSSINAEEDGIKRFKFQYKSGNGKFIDINEFFNNNSGRSNYTLPESITTNTLRLSILDGNPDEFNLLSFQAFESRGNAFLINDRMKLLTNPESGGLSTAIQSFQDKNTSFDKQIAKIEARVERDSERLTRQFASMEKIISGLQNQGNILSSTINNLPSRK